MLWCSTTICNNSSGVVSISIRVLSGSLTLGPYLLSVSSICEKNALLTAMNSTVCLESGDLPRCRGDSCLFLCCKQQRVLQSRESKAVREGEPIRCKLKVVCWEGCREMFRFTVAICNLQECGVSGRKVTHEFETEQCPVLGLPFKPLKENVKLWVPQLILQRGGKLGKEDLNNMKRSWSFFFL